MIVTKILLHSSQEMSAVMDVFRVYEVGVRAAAIHSKVIVSEYFKKCLSCDRLQKKCMYTWLMATFWGRMETNGLAYCRPEGGEAWY